MKKKLLFMAAVLLGGCGKTRADSTVKSLADLKELKATFENKVRGGEQRREDLSKEDKQGSLHDALARPLRNTGVLGRSTPAIP